MADPNVMVKGGGDVRQEGYVLSVGEVEKLGEALSAHQQVLGASEAFQNAADGPAAVRTPEVRVNRRRLSEQAQQIKTVLEKGRPQPIADKEKDRYVKRCDYLQSVFVPYLETLAELRVKRRDQPDWQSATEKARARTAQDPKTGINAIEAAIKEWQFIQRRLNPQDPDAGNLHTLRKPK